MKSKHSWPLALVRWQKSVTHSKICRQHHTQRRHAHSPVCSTKDATAACVVWPSRPLGLAAPHPVDLVLLGGSTSRLKTSAELPHGPSTLYKLPLNYPLAHTLASAGIRSTPATTSRDARA